MAIYNYTGFNNPDKIDEFLNKTSLAKEVETALPNKQFVVRIVGTSVVFTFNSELTTEEETTLANTYNSYNSYTETTFISIAKNWKENYVDYKKARAALGTELTIRGGFSNLSTLEKKIASRWFLCVKSDRDTVHTFDEQVTNGYFWHINARISRNNRLDVAIIEVYNRLDSADADNVIDDLWEIFLKINGKQYTRSLAMNYINFGREGTVEGNPEGLFDYILARVGTSFELTGLKAKAITPIHGTLDELCDKIIDILKNGNYTI